jgi:hypothetical protein
LVKRWTSILLLGCFLCIGTGVLEFVHDLQHQAEDVRADAMARAAGRPIQHHEHDESNCDVCAQLHMAIIVYHWVPLLVLLGLLVAFLTQLDTPLIPLPMPARLSCRGPPAVFASL